MPLVILETDFTIENHSFFHEDLDDRERRVARREREVDEAERLLQEKLGSKDILKTINELSLEKVTALNGKSLNLGTVRGHFFRGGGS